MKTTERKKLAKCTAGSIAHYGIEKAISEAKSGGTIFTRLSRFSFDKVRLPNPQTPFQQHQLYNLPYQGQKVEVSGFTTHFSSGDHTCDV